MGNCMNPSKPVKCGTLCIDAGEQGCQLKLKKNPLKTPDFSQKIP
jgi:hypothetical protein